MNHTRHTVFDALQRHPIHPFPARMAPGIALSALADAKKPLRVLDPMMGSGTVLAMARANGHHGLGIDLDPLAVLLARVWTTAIDNSELLERGAEVLDRAKRIFATLPVAAAYPPGSSDETHEFIRYWFDEYARRQLASLATAVSRVLDERIRDALWCAFSRLIITKTTGASRAMDLSHSRPHRAFERAPAKPFTLFPSAVAVVAKNCLSSKAKGRGARTNTNLGDARDLSFKSASVDLILTSPPYLNAIDYMRCSKFSLVWMGYDVEDLRKTRADIVGSEASDDATQDDADVQTVIRGLRLRPKLSPRHTSLLSRYVWDMREATSEAARVLKRGGRAIYVVGDSTVRGTYIRNSEIVRAVAGMAGLEMEERKSRVLPANRRYLPPPRRSVRRELLDARMRREVVLTFKK